MSDSQNIRIVSSSLRLDKPGALLDLLDDGVLDDMLYGDLKGDDGE